MTTEAIQIKNLSKTYRRGALAGGKEVEAISDLNLIVREGEFVSIFGPNGCGKTTLLLITAGVESPSSGTVLVKGRRPSDAVIGFVFQNYREALMPWRTCLDNIAFPLEVMGVERTERRERARALVKQFGLKIDLNSYPYQQSGGQQQLVAIARALVADPDVFVLDEPLSSLDVRTSLTTRTTIERIWERTRKTTLHVSHDVDEAIQLSDRIVLLGERPGRILEVIDNPLPRPRSQILEDKDASLLRYRILRHYMEGEAS